jgi:hypothetical protein
MIWGLQGEIRECLRHSDPPKKNGLPTLFAEILSVALLSARESFLETTAAQMQTPKASFITAQGKRPGLIAQKTRPALKARFIAEMRQARWPAKNPHRTLTLGFGPGLV